MTGRGVICRLLINQLLLLLVGMINRMTRVSGRLLAGQIRRLLQIFGATIAGGGGTFRACTIVRLYGRR